MTRKTIKCEDAYSSEELKEFEDKYIRNNNNIIAFIFATLYILQKFNISLNPS